MHHLRKTSQTENNSYIFCQALIYLWLPDRYDSDEDAPDLDDERQEEQPPHQNKRAKTSAERTVARRGADNGMYPDVRSDIESEASEFEEYNGRYNNTSDATQSRSFKGAEQYYHSTDEFPTEDWEAEI